MVVGKVDDGMKCLWSAVSQWRPHDYRYQRKIKKSMMDAHLLFRAGNPITYVRSLTFNLSECIALGVRLPFEETGAEIINTLSSRPNTTYSTFLHGFRNGGSDPDDCAPFLQELFAEIITAADAQVDVQTKRFDKHHRAFDANVMCDESHVLQWDDYDEVYVGVEKESSDNHMHDNVDPHMDVQSMEGGVYANDTRGFSPTKGGKGGKSMPFGGKASKGSKGYGKGLGKGKGGKGDTRDQSCGAEGCSKLRNVPFSFCDDCHAKGKQEGFIVLRGDSKYVMPQAFNKDKKRAYDAFAMDDSWVSNGFYDGYGHWHDGYYANDAMSMNDGHASNPVDGSMVNLVAEGIAAALAKQSASDSQSAVSQPSIGSSSVAQRLAAMAAQIQPSKPPQ